tara:strand:+ start:981 stop:1202 length:222 start_codon:yes stop_codon:yes gene_type:complete
MIRNNSAKKEGSEMSYYPKTVANKMTKGLKTQSEKLFEIGKVLHDLGNSRIEVRYYMSVDEDFISDVLSCYRA